MDIYVRLPGKFIYCYAAGKVLGVGRWVNILERTNGVGRGLEEKNEELGLQVVKLASIFVLCGETEVYRAQLFCSTASLASVLSCTLVP